MTVLTNQDRIDVWTDWMRQNLENIPITKTELRAAIDAADDWANTNAAAFNAALPLPARTALSPTQKTALLSFVIAKRWAKGS